MLCKHHRNKGHSRIMEQALTRKDVQTGFLDVCHASQSIVKTPYWQTQRPGNPREVDDRDFGTGFYMCNTADQWYPIRLYSRRSPVILNEYKLDLSGIKPLKMGLNLVWVLVVAAHKHRTAGNRADEKQQWTLLSSVIREKVETYDLVIAPISDDNFYTALDDFIDNKVSESYMIDVVNFMNYPTQYVSKSNKADKNIHFTGHREISTSELQAEREAFTVSNDEMRLTIREKRRAERDAVSNGNAQGRLFRDITTACFTDYSTKEDLSNIVGGWLMNGEC